MGLCLYMEWMGLSCMGIQGVSTTLAGFLRIPILKLQCSWWGLYGLFVRYHTLKTARVSDLIRTVNCAVR